MVLPGHDHHGDDLDRRLGVHPLMIAGPVAFVALVALIIGVYQLVEWINDRDERKRHK